MLEFRKEIDFDKLYIDTDYIFDIIFWVDTEWIEDTKGNLVHLRNVIATQRDSNENIEIMLNIADDEDACDAHQENMDYFKNGKEIENQILDYVKKYIDEIKYTQEDKITKK